jgi:hypothetical protein
MAQAKCAGELWVSCLKPVHAVEAGGKGAYTHANALPVVRRIASERPDKSAIFRANPLEKRVDVIGISLVRFSAQNRCACAKSSKASHDDELLKPSAWCAESWKGENSGGARD